MSAVNEKTLRVVRAALVSIYGIEERKCSMNAEKAKEIKRAAAGDKRICVFALLSQLRSSDHEERLEKILKNAMDGLSGYDALQSQFKQYVWCNCDHWVFRLIDKSLQCEPKFLWDFVVSVPLRSVFHSAELSRLIDTKSERNDLPLTPFQYLLLLNQSTTCEMMEMVHKVTVIGDWWRPIDDYCNAPNIFHMLALTEAYLTMASLSLFENHREQIKDALNYQDQLGMTPLHIAAVRAGTDGNEAGAAYHFIRKYIKLGADRGIKTDSGHTALDLFKACKGQNVNKDGAEARRLCRWMLEPSTTINEIEDGDVPNICPASYRSTTQVPKSHTNLLRFMRLLKRNEV